jgi:hypothetical protein
MLNNTNQSAVDMNTVKIALTLLTIAITVGPLVYVVFIYRDNLVGLVLPPQFANLGQNLGQNISDGNSSGNPSSSPLNITGITGSDFQMPQLVSDPQYNPDTGEFSLSVNVTNPLTNELSIDQLSVQIQSKDNNALVGNISIPQPINIQPGESSIINVTGIMPQDMFNQISGQNTGNIDVNNIILKNLDVVVGGVKIHFDEFDPSSIQSLGGL